MLKRYFEILRLICGNVNARREMRACLKTACIQIILCCACFTLAFALSFAMAWLFDSLRYSYHATAKTLLLTALLVICLLSVFAVIMLACGLAAGLTILIPNGVRASLDKLILRRWEESDHGQTIAEVIMRIRNQPVEYCAIFDDDGNKISEGTAFNRQKCYTPRTQEFEAMPNYSGVMIHNHPSNDMAFSANDFAALIAGGFRKGIVVTRKLLYTLEIPEHVVEEVDYEDLRHDVEIVLGTLYSTPNNTFMMWKWKPGRVAAWYGACQAIAYQYGMILTVEKLSECSYAKEYRKARRQAFFKTFFGIYTEPDDTHLAEHPEETLLASPKKKRR